MKLRRNRRSTKHESEQQILSVFWPNDYPVGSAHMIGSREYVVSRIERIPRSRFLAVWGYEPQPQTSALEQPAAPERSLPSLNHPAADQFA